MDLEDRVSFIKMRIHKFRKTYKLNVDPTRKPSKPLFRSNNNDESNSEKLREKLKV